MKLHRTKTTYLSLIRWALFCYHMKLHRTKTNVPLYSLSIYFVTIWNYIVLKLSTQTQTGKRYFVTIWNYIVLKLWSCVISWRWDFVTIWNYIVLKHSITHTTIYCKFCYHMKLHRTKTCLIIYITECWFCYHMKLHRTKTVFCLLNRRL